MGFVWGIQELVRSYQRVANSQVRGRPFFRSSGERAEVGRGLR